MLPLPCLRVSCPSRLFFARYISCKSWRGFPQENKVWFTKGHEWIRFDEQQRIGTVGMTAYAQQALGDVVFVELPSVGQAVRQKDMIGAVESVKAASDVYAPLSGKVTEVNEALRNRPQLVSKSPTIEGWLCKLQVAEDADRSEWEELLTESGYKAFCQEMEAS